MKSAFSREKIFLIIALFLAIIVIGSLLFFSNKSNPNPAQPIPVYISPTPSPAIVDDRPDTNTSYINSFENTYKAEAPIIAQQAKVADLIKKLPYSGTNFTLSYDINTNKFTLTLKQGNTDAGNAEFDSYLSANQIPNRSLLGTIVINSQ